MSNKQDKKQFPLVNKNNCIIYLYKIISNCELCMDDLKTYNEQLKKSLDEHRGQDRIPRNLYQDWMHKTYDIMCYLANLLGDGQKSSISYFKYRDEIQKRIKRGNTDIPLHPLSSDTQDILTEFNKTRNWLNHVPESILVAEMDLIKAGKLKLPLDPVEIVHHNFVSYEYFEHLHLSNDEFYKNARKIIQAAKKDYSLLLGKTVTYQRVYTDELMGTERAEVAKMSAKVQGLKSEI